MQKYNASPQRNYGVIAVFLQKTNNMNRSKYFDYIEERLNVLSVRINSGGKLNILNLHVHSENFYRDFLNKLYGWKLDNLNANLQNVEAIDLVDSVNKFVIQVSSTSTRKKIEDSLKKDSLKNYSNYTFKFVSIANNADNLRKITDFKNPHNISFEPKNDVIDKDAIIAYILNLDINTQREIYEFIKKELGNEVDAVKLDSNLATIINILAKEDLNILDENSETRAFGIEQKITYNDLDRARYIINDYAKNHIQVEKKYTEFDKNAVNKSSSVLAVIKKIYLETTMAIKNPDAIFFDVIKKVINVATESANFVKIPYEELELCVNILVVDAFIRCKIFENPNKS